MRGKKGSNTNYHNVVLEGNSPPLHNLDPQCLFPCPPAKGWSESQMWTRGSGKNDLD